MNDEITERKKEWLRRYIRNCEKVNKLKEKLAILEERATSPKSPNYSGMPRGSSSITPEDIIYDKIELETRIERLENRGKEYRKEILNAIDTLDDIKYSEILEEWFIYGGTLDDIAERVGYSSRHAIRIYARAIDTIVIPDILNTTKA